MARGRIHMAGTRGPLHAHILVREGTRRSASRNGWSFSCTSWDTTGAAHSPELAKRDAAVLGDKRAGRSDFRIKFDPVNALTIGMITEEMRRSNISKVSQLQLRHPTAAGADLCASWLARCPKTQPAFNTRGSCGQMKRRWLVSTRQVVQQIVRAAVENRGLPPTVIEGSKQPARREGDALTAYYRSRSGTSGQPRCRPKFPPRHSCSPSRSV